MQLLAAGILHSRPIGLDRGHIGRICDALTDSGLDLTAWTAKALLAALNADMKTRGWDWPNQVKNPAAFLKSRLQLLPVRPPQELQSLVTVSRQDRIKAVSAVEAARESHRNDQALRARWCADVTAVTTEAQRATLLRAHKAKYGYVADPVRAIAEAGRRVSRLYPSLPLAEALNTWVEAVLDTEPGTVTGDQHPAVTSLSDDLLVNMASGNCDCVNCGAPNAPTRPQLPYKAMSMVCDTCWPAIAAELDQASAVDQEMVA